jgi:hypothetical protein
MAEGGRRGRPTARLRMRSTHTPTCLQEFEGGPRQIGIHGRDGLGGTLGRAESLGRIRLATARRGSAVDEQTVKRPE